MGDGVSVAARRGFGVVLGTYAASLGLFELMSTAVPILTVFV